MDVLLWNNKTTIKKKKKKNGSDYKIFSWIKLDSQPLLTNPRAVVNTSCEKQTSIKFVLKKSQSKMFSSELSKC